MRDIFKYDKCADVYQTIFYPCRHLMGVQTYSKLKTVALFDLRRISFSGIVRVVPCTGQQYKLYGPVQKAPQQSISTEMSCTAQKLPKHMEDLRTKKKQSKQIWVKQNRWGFRNPIYFIEQNRKQSRITISWYSGKRIKRTVWTKNGVLKKKATGLFRLFSTISVY